MSGRWLPPAAPPHRCDLPKLDGMFPAPEPGARWKCDCGKVYRVTKHGETWLVWTLEGRSWGDRDG